MISAGVNAVCCAGGVGEFYALTETDHRQVVEAAVRASGGRAPVIAGVGHATRIASALAHSAAKAGASGVMVNPMYFVDPSVDGLSITLDHVGAIRYFKTDERFTNDENRKKHENRFGVDGYDGVTSIWC